MTAGVIYPRTLSKSDYLTARDCSAKLYFRENRYADASASNAYLRLLSMGGYMVEALACAQRADGILLKHGRDAESDFRTTREYLNRENVTLFQGTLLHQRRLARVDIIEKRGNVVKLIEVKAKSFNGEEHAASLAAGGRGVFRGKRSPYAIASEWRAKFEELAFQAIILERVLPRVTVKPFLLLVDKSKHAGVDDIPTLFAIETGQGENDDRVVGVRYNGTPEQLQALDLLTEVDASAEVAELKDEIDAAALRFASMLDDEFSVPIAERGAKCSGCDYRLPEGGPTSGFDLCWGPLASVKPHALELFSIGKVKDENGAPLIESMVTGGKASLFDIPTALLRKKDGTVGLQAARQIRQIEHTRSGEAWIGPELRGTIEGVRYPLHFIDFEASRIALPYHAKMRPYGQVAFQWSDHAVESAGADPVHREWLNVEYTWPNIAFAASLRDAIGDSGTVLTWSPFERSALREIVAEHERFAGKDHELIEWVADLEENRMLDLHKCAANDFYHPGMGGRTSIKVVMDTLWKTDATLRDQLRRWSGLDVADSADPYKSLPKLVIADVEQEVHEGTGAIRAYEAMMYGVERTDAQTKAQWSRLLLQYCKLDTLSMVLVYEYWRRCTGLA